MIPPLSILDLAIIGEGRTAADALSDCVEVARRAEACGYRRVWYAEHHNMSAIASSATSVVIATVAERTSTIRIGSGGIMLPNHSPLTIAEQFGTLETLHPGRIDLGLGRAPGTDQVTIRALRRTGAEAERFPDDVLELQAYLAGDSTVPGVVAVPGAGTRVPLYILGSSLFGARLAARFGLPYAFASHFAPGALQQAVELYRAEFQPSEQLDRPHVIAALNVVAADDVEDALAQFERVLRARIARFLGRGRTFTEAEIEQLIESPQGRQVAQMMIYTAVGTHREVASYVEGFAEHADADELIVNHAGPTLDDRLRSVEILAEVAASPAAA